MSTKYIMLIMWYVDMKYRVREERHIAMHFSVNDKLYLYVMNTHIEVSWHRWIFYPNNSSEQKTNTINIPMFTRTWTNILSVNGYKMSSDYILLPDSAGCSVILSGVCQIDSTSGKYSLSHGGKIGKPYWCFLRMNSKECLYFLHTIRNSDVYKSIVLNHSIDYTCSTLLSQTHRVLSWKLDGIHYVPLM